MQIVDKIKEIIAKKTLHQTIYVYIGMLVNGVSLFALNIVLARALNQELFGMFSLAILLLGTVGELSDFGLNAGLLRFVPYYIATNQPEKLKQLIKTIWQWRLYLTIILTTSGVVFAHPLAKYIFNEEKLSPYLLFASLGIGGVILLGFTVTYLQAEQKFTRNAVVQSLKGVLRLLMVIFFMALGIKNLYVYIFAYIFIPWMLFFINFKELPKNFVKYVATDEVKQKLHSQLAKFSFWLTIASLSSIIGSRVDQAMISSYLGVAQVAIFTVAWQLIQFFPIIFNSISSVLIPKISSLKNKDELKVFIKRTFKWIIVGTLGVAILVYPSQYLIHFLFGQKYDAAMPIYLILAYCMLLNFPSIPFYLISTAFNCTHFIALFAIIQLIINVVFNFIFIPKYGIIGSAYTFVVSMSLQFLWSIALTLYLMKKKEFIIT